MSGTQNDIKRPRAEPEALYHEAIVEAARAAAGAGQLENATASASVDNPLCGDQVTVHLRMEAGRVDALAHTVRGCLLCEAAASLIGAHAPGQTPAQLRAVTAQVEALLATGTPPDPAVVGERWRDLAMFTPVRNYKSRHQCVRLPFQALLRALES